MTGYLTNRLLQMALTLFLILTVTFFLVQAQPGDYASFYVLNPDIPSEVKEQIRATFGLDKPPWQQYLIHLKNTFTGNFGVSFGHYPRPVLEVLMERLPRTLVLFGTATAISFYVGFLLGKAIAWRRGGFLEYAATISGTTLFTVFTPAFALMMIWIFAFQLGWFSGRQIPRSACVARYRRCRQLRLQPHAHHSLLVHLLRFPRDIPV